MKGDPRIQRHGLIQDFRFWFSDSFQQWNLISGFQLLVGFRIPRDVFWNPNPMQDSTFNKQKFSQNPHFLSWEGGFHEPLIFGNLC